MILGVDYQMGITDRTKDGIDDDEGWRWAVRYNTRCGYGGRLNSRTALKLLERLSPHHPLVL